MDHPYPTPCPQWEEKLAALHPDNLSPAERKALEVHLATCQACAAVLAEYRRMRELVCRTFTPESPPGIWKSFLPREPEK